MGKKDAQRLARLQQLAEQDPENEVVRSVASTAATKKTVLKERHVEATDKEREAMSEKKRKSKSEKQEAMLAKIAAKRRREQAAAEEEDAMEVDEDEDGVGAMLPRDEDQAGPYDEEEDHVADAGALPGVGDQTMHFDLAPLQEGDGPALFDFLDRFLFDNFVAKENGQFVYCDREDFAAALIQSPMSSLVTVAQDEEGDEEEEDEEEESSEEGDSSDEEEDIDPTMNVATMVDNDNGLPEGFGLLSVLDIGRGAAIHPSYDTLRQLLARPPFQILQRGASVAKLLEVADPSEPSKALLLLNEHMSSIPGDVAVQQLQFTLNTAAEHMMEQLEIKSAKKRSKILYADPSTAILVVMAKIQRLSKSDEAAPRNKKQKLEKTTANTFNMDNYAFLREEDELLYRGRDERVAVVVHRFQPEYDKQPESEIPLCVVFGIPFVDALSAFSMIEGDGDEEEEE